MSLLRKKSWWQKITHSRLTLVLVIGACAAMSLAVYDRYVVERSMAERRAEKEAELQALKERKTEMEQKVDYLKGEEGIEAEIRQHFDVAREGEQVIVLTGEGEESEQPKTAPSDSRSESWWRRVLP